MIWPCYQVLATVASLMWWNVTWDKPEMPSVVFGCDISTWDGINMKPKEDKKKPEDVIMKCKSWLYGQLDYHECFMTRWLSSSLRMLEVLVECTIVDKSYWKPLLWVVSYCLFPEHSLGGKEKFISLVLHKHSFILMNLSEPKLLLLTLTSKCYHISDLGFTVDIR